MYQETALERPDRQTPPPVEKDALQMENEILNLFVGMVNPKPKKIVNLAKKLMFERTHSIEQRLLKDIIYHTDPLGFVQRCLALLDDLTNMIPGMVADGYHGVIIIKDEVFPTKVNAPQSWLVRGQYWDPEQEYEIQKQVVGEYLETYDKNYALCKVVLFSDFGFSGIPRIIEGRRNPDIPA